MVFSLIQAARSAHRAGAVGATGRGFRDFAFPHASGEGGHLFANLLPAAGGAAHAFPGVPGAHQLLKDRLTIPAFEFVKRHSFAPHEW